MAVLTISSHYRFISTSWTSASRRRWPSLWRSSSQAKKSEAHCIATLFYVFIRLDVLVNNAGCMVAARELTKEGLDRNWATNVLGTYLLTTGLLPLLQRADKPR